MFKHLLVFSGCFILSSCLTLSSTPLTLHIDASKTLNPDVTLTSLPVRIKIYQLNDPEAFNEATFKQLWKNDIKTLGNSLLVKKEMTINPGESQQLKLSRQKNAEYIAIIGVFRQHEDDGWKAVKILPGQVNTYISKIFISAKGHEVEIR